MKKIQVFLATYNRPHLVEKAIDSILNQSFKSFELIISDNSTNDETKDIFEKKYQNKAKYIRRTQTTSFHFNLILKEVESEYFMIFHDDDVMHNNMLETLYNKISARNEIIAIGSNARVIRYGKPNRRLFYNNLKEDIVINSREQMIEAYFKTGMIPLPSYLYRLEVTQSLRFNLEHGGKHSDASFIIDLLNFGSVIFCSSPLMDYYIHPNQDSSQNVFIDKIKLVNYISKTSCYHRSNKLFEKYRMLNLYSEIKYDLLNNRKLLFSKRYCFILKLICKVSPFEYFPKILLITIYSISKSFFLHNH